MPEFNRKEAERTITRVLYPIDEPTGAGILADLLSDWGLACLTDDAVIELARRQQNYEARIQ